MFGKDKEKRGEYRFEDRVTVFIETMSTPNGQRKLDKNIVVSRTVDLSANGLQIIMDHPLPLNSVLQLCVEITGDSDQRYRLAGEIMWLSETSKVRQYLVGFNLLDSDQTDILEWKDYICQRLAEEMDQTS